MTQNLWDAAKAVLGGKFIAIQPYLKRQETSQINNLTLQLKQLEKEEQKKPQSQQKERNKKIRLEINEKESVYGGGGALAQKNKVKKKNLAIEQKIFAIL